jgi:hypothetical protein
MKEELKRWGYTVDDNGGNLDAQCDFAEYHHVTAAFAGPELSPDLRAGVAQIAVTTLRIEMVPQSCAHQMARCQLSLTGTMRPTGRCIG